MGEAPPASVPATGPDRTGEDEGESPPQWAAEFNLLWLVDVAREVACEVLDRGRAPNHRLDVLFGRIERVNAGEGGFTLSLRDGEVDVLFLYDLLPSLAAGYPRQNRPGEVEVLVECRRVLRENGCVCFRLENGNWYRNLLRRVDPRRTDAAGRPPTPATMGSWLRKAGFTDHRIFFVSPDESFPAATIVPASTAAAVAHLRSELRPSHLRRYAGRALAHAGLGSLLYPRMVGVGLS